MAKVFYDKDAKLAALKGKKIAIIGFGSQGHAHAMNLKESGFDVRVGLYPESKSWPKAHEAGLPVEETPDACQEADVIMILVPDELQGVVYAEDVAPSLTAGKVLAFAHGFNIHFGQICPPEDVDVVMIAPKGPGHMVRRVYTEGSGVPSLIAVYQDASGKARDVAMAYACGIGAGRAGIIETTFLEETETDLFGEQCVLCGGTTSLVKAAFETLVEAGYQPEIAYFECMHELKLIVDLMYEKGLAGMRYSISNTAEYGDMTVGPFIVDEEVKDRMKYQLEEIQSGRFAKDWILENRAGRPQLKRLREIESEHLIEKVGKELRAMFSWIGK